MLRDESLAEFQHIRICGLMGMATNTDDTGLIREEFRKIHDLFIELKETLCKDNVDFKEISMGMSHDYPVSYTHLDVYKRQALYLDGSATAITKGLPGGTHPRTLPT